MKFKSLQFGKAMSAALFVLLLSLAGMKNALAQNQVATLQHEGNITMFYGANAFQNANDAAVDGDTITLSSGSFRGCTLSKAVTIHGAGCVEDTATGIMPTTIIDPYYITLNNQNNVRNLSLEGINCGSMSYQNGCKNVNISKCNISGFSVVNSPSGSIYNFSWGNCIIKNFYYSGSRTVFVNCILGLGDYYQNNSEDINTIYNSIIVGGNKLNNTMVMNSIIATSNTYYNISNSTFYNCIGISPSGQMLFNGQVNSTNLEVDNYSDVFETFDGIVTYDNSYQLKEEIANFFLGNDGTEVGIYGGMMPYNPRPSYMIIKRCNVAGRTTEDNKLSVEIELNTGD